MQTSSACKSGRASWTAVKKLALPAAPVWLSHTHKQTHTYTRKCPLFPIWMGLITQIYTSGRKISPLHHEEWSSLPGRVNWNVKGGCSKQMVNISPPPGSHSQKYLFAMCPHRNNLLNNRWISGKRCSKHVSLCVFMCFECDIWLKQTIAPVYLLQLKVFRSLTIGTLCCCRFHFKWLKLSFLPINLHPKANNANLLKTKNVNLSFAKVFRSLIQ